MTEDEMSPEDRALHHRQESDRAREGGRGMKLRRALRQIRPWINYRTAGLLFAAFAVWRAAIQAEASGSLEWLIIGIAVGVFGRQLWQEWLEIDYWKPTKDGRRRAGPATIGGDR